MEIFLPKSFQREAAGVGVSDDDCRAAIERAEKGLVDADLGKGLIKQRISRRNQGAARGFRAVAFYKRGKIAIFLHVFAKSKKANLTKVELELYSQAAAALDRLTATEFIALSV